MAASPLTVYKLITLYLLSQIEEPLSAARISDFILENGYTNYLSLNQAFSELSESGLISLESRGSRTFFRLTKDGEETLQFFEEDLNSEIRVQCRAFLHSNSVQIRADADTTAEYRRTDTGNYEVHMTVMERLDPVIDVTLSVPDESMARTMTENWQEKSQEIYAQIMATLL